MPGWRLNGCSPSPDTAPSDACPCRLAPTPPRSSPYDLLLDLVFLGGRQTQLRKDGHATTDGGGPSDSGGRYGRGRPKGTGFGYDGGAPYGARADESDGLEIRNPSLDGTTETGRNRFDRQRCRHPTTPVGARRRQIGDTIGDTVIGRFSIPSDPRRHGTPLVECPGRPPTSPQRFRIP
jgi:hypothetical protein